MSSHTVIRMTNSDLSRPEFVDSLYQYLELENVNEFSIKLNTPRKGVKNPLLKHLIDINGCNGYPKLNYITFVDTGDIIKV